MISEKDEGLHPPGQHRYWNESLYFNFMCDPSANSTHQNTPSWGGAIRIGHSPNQGHRDGFIIFYFPDGKAGFIRYCDESQYQKDVGSPVKAQSISLTCVEPFKVWKIAYTGPVYVFDDPNDASNFHKITLSKLPSREVNINLTFTCYHPPFDFHRAMKIRGISFRRLLEKLNPAYLLSHAALGIKKLSSILVMSGASHYEQAGFVNGVITIDDQPHEFSGTGQRDHSWGVRDMRVINSWQWFSCQFGEDLAFNATRVEFLGFQAIGGHVYYQGECHPLKNWTLDAKYDDTNKWAKTFSLLLTLENGTQLTITGEADINFPVLHTTEGLTAQVNEALALFHWNGQSSTGISEFMGQLYP